MQIQNSNQTKCPECDGLMYLGVCDICGDDSYYRNEDDFDIHIDWKDYEDE